MDKEQRGSPEGMVYMSRDDLTNFLEDVAKQLAGQIQRDLTQSEFAKTLGMSIPTIWRHSKTDDNYRPAYYVGDCPRYKWEQIERIRKERDYD